MNRVVRGQSHIRWAAVVVGGLLLAFCATTPAFADSTPTLTQQINAGTLSTDILDGSKVTVTDPVVAMTAKNFSSICRSGGDASTGTLGTATARVYVINPSGADNGWTLSIAATSGASALWTNGAGDAYDFNDASGSGCTDGLDTDTKAGQLTVDASGAILTLDCDSACSATGITKGSSTGFSEGTTDNVTLLSAGPTASKVWEGYLTGITLSQTIPGNTPAGAYSLNLTLTAVAL